MSWPLRIVVLGRVSVALFLLVPYAIAAWGVSGHALSAAIGSTLYGLWTLVWVVFAFARSGRSLSGIITATAVVDAVGLAFLNGPLAAYGDPLLAWYMVEAAVFSMILLERRSWMLGGMLALSYALGHMLGRGTLMPVQYLFVVVNTVSIVAISVGMARILGGQEERRAEIEMQRAAVLDLNRKLERSVAELRAVTEITELIHSTLEVELVGPRLLEILERVINLPTASLYVIDKSKQETIFSASTAGSGMAPRSYSGLELAGALPVGSADGALSCIELLDHNQMVVVLCAGDHSVEELTEANRAVLLAVASELVVAVENSRLYRLTKRLAITDELTDLYNYRFLQQRLDDELGRAGRYDKRLSLLMLDLDDFKRVNDTYGHLVGDSVLFELGQLLKSTVREVDVVARYGGEEFTVILPETDVSGAFIVAEKVREAISLHRFPDAAGGRTIHITASIGLSNYPVHASDKESLLRTADDAVYRAKETGKDRVRAPRLAVRRVPAGSEEIEGAVE